MRSRDMAIVWRQFPTSQPPLSSSPPFPFLTRFCNQNDTHFIRTGIILHRTNRGTPKEGQQIAALTKSGITISADQETALKQPVVLHHHKGVRCVLFPEKLSIPCALLRCTGCWSIVSETISSSGSIWWAPGVDRYMVRSHSAFWSERP